MDIVVVGLGCFGFNWLETILLQHENIRVIGLVDQNKDMLEKAKELNLYSGTVFCTDLQECLSITRPDCVLNITPPHIHKEIAFEALELGIPVLCEKPIAEGYEDALAILNKSVSSGVPVMIAENYRYMDIMRTAKKLITSGEIGKLNSLQIDFQRNHKMDNYHKDLLHPLLLDVAVHHIDLIRYLTGAEGQSVFAESWTPTWSWYRGYSNLYFLLNMENQIRVSYRGSLSAFKNETDWPANWRIEGEKGIITISGQEIKVEKAHDTSVLKLPEAKDGRKMVLEEFINALKEKRAGETDITDNIRTFQIVQAAMDSVTKKISVQIKRGE